MARGRHPRRYAQLGGQRAAEELRELFQGVGKPLWWHVVDDHNNGLASFDNRGDAEAFAAAKRDELGENVYLVRHQNGKAGTLEKAFTVPVRKNPRKPTRKAQRRNPFRPAFRAGERVEIASHFDAWMRGDRYGEVVKHSQRFGVYVKMDKSGKTLRFAPDDLTPLNPPTRKARAFIGRKIRRLAREGMQAPRRVAAAYRLARRAGFKVPKRARKNPSEGIAWSTVLATAKHIRSAFRHPGAVQADAEEIIRIASEMLEQVSRGIHENPTLAILGNPPAKVVGTLSHRLYELRYKHAEDGKDYRHPFGPGAKVLLLADKSVWIKARHSLWEDHR